MVFQIDAFLYSPSCFLKFPRKKAKKSDETFMGTTFVSNCRINVESSEKSASVSKLICFLMCSGTFW